MYLCAFNYCNISPATDGGGDPASKKEKPFRLALYMRTEYTLFLVLYICDLIICYPRLPFSIACISSWITRF